MSRHDADDDLGGFEDLSDRQKWAVSRFRARTGRYHRDRMAEDPWERFDRAEEEEERRRFGPV